MKHFSYSELDMYIDGELPFWKRLACKRHLRSCAVCQENLALLEEDKDLILRLRAARGRVRPDCTVPEKPGESDS